MKIKHLGKIVEAHRWFRNGDHPDDECKIYTGGDGLSFWGEGHIVRYFRHPIFPEKLKCKCCGLQMHIHGWIEEWVRDKTKIGYQRVCPGDWIVKEGNNYKSYPSGFFSTPDDMDKRSKQ